MNINHNMIFPMVYTKGIEIDTWVKVDEVTTEEGCLEYNLDYVGVWSDRRDCFVLPSDRLLRYIERKLDNYPDFIDMLESYAAMEEEERQASHADYLYEMEKDRRLGL